MLERFLARLSKSKYQDKFIFKGGLLLAHYLEIGRETMEVLSQPHMEYSGFRVQVIATLGKMKDRIQIDIGVGDLVIPNKEDLPPFEYKGKPIFTGGITLMVYPVETIFAEKLETVISKGVTNSRMKDYHDLLLMIRENNLLDIKKLLKVTTVTFQHRDTELKLPVQFDDDSLTRFQKLWTNHLRGLGNFKDKLRLPNDFLELLLELNSWLKKSSIKSEK